MTNQQIQTAGYLRGYISTREVYLDQVMISPSHSQSLINHSPDGFNWGYGGSGPAQLALAVLLKYMPEETALQNYQQFKWDVIATLPKGDFELPIAFIRKWISKLSTSQIAERSL